jgi:hypothetical protein
LFISVIGLTGNIGILGNPLLAHLEDEGDLDLDSLLRSGSPGKPIAASGVIVSDTVWTLALQGSIRQPLTLKLVEEWEDLSSQKSKQRVDFSHLEMNGLAVAKLIVQEIEVNVHRKMLKHTVSAIGEKEMDIPEVEVAGGSPAWDILIHGESGGYLYNKTMCRWEPFIEPLKLQVKLQFGVGGKVVAIHSTSPLQVIGFGLNWFNNFFPFVGI